MNMVIIYLTVGGLWILVMSILRTIFLKPQGGFYEKIKAIFRIPKVDGNPNEMIFALSQAMGFLWLFLGIFWAITEQTLTTNTIGIFAEGFGIFLPPILHTSISPDFVQVMRCGFRKPHA